MRDTSLAQTLRGLLRPICGFCLRHSIKLQDVVENLKLAFLEAAEAELKRTGAAVSTSRLSVMTGVHRRDVTRLYRGDNAEKSPTNVVARVLGQWEQDRRFCDAKGQPRVLSFEGTDDNEFLELVGSVSKDLNSYTVLFELERIGAVERTKRGLRLQSRVFVPQGDQQEGLQMLVKDSEDLMNAVQENLMTSQRRTPNLHLKTEYDRIPCSALDKVRSWLLKEGIEFHERARAYLSRFDLDVNRRKDSTDDVARVAVGTFSVTQREQ